MNSNLNSHQKLIDQHGRKIRKLRVSLLDACNLRCFYCMPNNPQFMSSRMWITPERIFEICSRLKNWGVQEVRVTGGEPTLRKEFREIISGLSELNFSKLALTTNGILLRKHLSYLANTKLSAINLSIDSLRRERFNKISRFDGLPDVLKSLQTARKLGFKLKLNVVLMRGINDDEIFDFVKFSKTEGIEVRFLELMKIGQASTHLRQQFISADEVIDKLKQRINLIPKVMEVDSTSFNFVTQDGSNIGFIASESKPFCGNCSRWRLSADGKLRACLMSKKGLTIEEVEKNFKAAMEKMLLLKPTDRIHHIQQDMNQIGG